MQYFSVFYWYAVWLQAVYEGSDESVDQEQEMQDDTTTHPSPEHSHPRTFTPALKRFLKQITKPM